MPLRHRRRPTRFFSQPLRYRRAQPGDIRAMSAIRLSVAENVLSDPGKVTLQMYRDYLHRLGRGWVCCAGREVIGFAYASREDGSIWALFVKPGYESRGICRRLMAHAAGWLFAVGHSSITLSTGRSTRADRFYGELGWIRERDDGGNVHFRLCALSKGEAQVAGA